jgi:Transposase DDE domain
VVTLPRKKVVTIGGISRQGKHFCYNAQVVVDQEHKLLLCNEVVSQENDKGMLQPMVEKAESVLEHKPKEVLADAGYYQMSQVEELEKKGIECFVAINGNQEENKAEEYGITFQFNQRENNYVCSQGQKLQPFRTKRDHRRGTEAQAYRGINCQPCFIKKLCTKSEIARTVYRFTNQEWRDRYRTKLSSDLGTSKLKLRMCLSEHPFGTIKCWMGHIPLLLRGKKKVQTEINIYSIAYNFKRMLNLASFEDLTKIYRPTGLRVG